jgi:hypothetical protein
MEEGEGEEDHHVQPAQVPGKADPPGESYLIFIPIPARITFTFFEAPGQDEGEGEEEDMEIDEEDEEDEEDEGNKEDEEDEGAPAAEPEHDQLEEQSKLYNTLDFFKFVDNRNA